MGDCGAAVGRVEGMEQVNIDLQQAKSRDSFLKSRQVAGVAVLLWLVSLALPAFILFAENGFGKSDFSLGWQVLLGGWLGPIGLNFGWFANIFWLLAICTLIQKGGSAANSARWAAVVSLNTFTFEFIPNAVNGGNPIYGLGIGAVIWLIAISLALLAAAIREKELTGEVGFLKFSQFYLAGLITVIFALSIHDRVIGNEDERNKLNNSLGAFKRSQVCTISPKPKNKILLNGSLELATSKTYFLDEPERLLKLGIPVVRKEGKDYFLEILNNVESMKSRPASTKISATLRTDYVEFSLRAANGGDHDSTWSPIYHVSLITPEGVVGFEMDVMKQYVGYICPNMEELIKQTLVFPAGKN